MRFHAIVRGAIETYGGNRGMPVLNIDVNLPLVIQV